MEFVGVNGHVQWFDESGVHTDTILIPMRQKLFAESMHNLILQKYQRHGITDVVVTGWDEIYGEDKWNELTGEEAIKMCDFAPTVTSELAEHAEHTSAKKTSSWCHVL